MTYLTYKILLTFVVAKLSCYLKKNFFLVSITVRVSIKDALPKLAYDSYFYPIYSNTSHTDSTDSTVRTLVWVTWWLSHQSHDNRLQV